MVIAAQLELEQGIKLPPRHFRGELDLAGGKHIGRGRYDRSRGGQAAARRHDLNARARAPFDRGRRLVALHWQPRRQLGQQRAEALAAESIDVPFGRAREVERRNLRQILATTEWTEEELNGRAPLAKILWQRLRARHVALARGFSDRGGGAHLQRQKILHLTFARETPADAYALTRRSRIDVEPALGRKLG